MKKEEAKAALIKLAEEGILYSANEDSILIKYSETSFIEVSFDYNYSGIVFLSFKRNKDEDPINKIELLELGDKDVYHIWFIRYYKESKILDEKARFEKYSKFLEDVKG